MDVMARLKEESRDLHFKTEQTALSSAMLDGSVSRTEYVGLLSLYARLHEALESAIDASSAPSVRAVVTPALFRAGLARSDLDALSLAGLSPSGPSSPPGRSSPVLERHIAALECAIRVADGPELLGMLYVLEGASLGGVFLAPKLVAALGLRESECRFFRGHGAATMMHWGAFKKRMNGAVTEASDGDRAVAAARRAFDALGPIFDAITEACRAEPARASGVSASAARHEEERAAHQAHRASAG
jgi:heme oxygenase